MIRGIKNSSLPLVDDEATSRRRFVEAQGRARQVTADLITNDLRIAGCAGTVNPIT